VLDFTNLGYTKPLYILPFDHRTTFAKKIFGKDSIADLDSQEKETIREFKMLIYKGFKDAVEKLIPTDSAAILCDEEFGTEILIDALHNGFLTLLPVEKSGQAEFDFQYAEFGEHIEKFHPSFVKALVRFNPGDEESSKQRQKDKLKRLSDYCHENNHKFLLEVLIIPTETQLKEAGTRQGFDRKMRPVLAAEVTKDMQDFGVEPDVWKLEGFEKREDYKEIIQAIKRGGRENVNLIILGRGAREEEVEKWLEVGAKEEVFEVGAKVEGVIGFAVGRTVFWQAIEKFYKGEIGKAEVIQTVSENFQNLYKIFIGHSS
jgi:myo-inositol catabolism protein IolC